VVKCHQKLLTLDTATHIPTKLHQFLVSNSSVIVWTRMHTVTHRWTGSKTIHCFVGAN